MQSKQLTEYKRHWKGVVLDYDYLLLQDDSIEYMVCLTELELQILLAILLPAQWKTRYYSDTQEVSQDVIDAWVDGIYLELMGYCMPCDNFSISIDVSYEQIIGTLINQYDGTPSSVNPNAPDDYFSDSSERERALCMALNAYVRSYVSAWLRHAQIILALGLIGLFFGAVPVLGWVAVVLIGGLAYVTQTYVDALSDDDAIDTVLCCWLDGLIGEPISRVNWASALASCQYEGGHEYLIQQVLASETAYDKQWVSFLDALGNAFPIAQAGVSDCPCEECEYWDYTFNFTVGDGGFSPSPANRAAWQNGLGWGRGSALPYTVQIQSDDYNEFKITAIEVTVSTALTGRRYGQFRVPDVNGVAYDIVVDPGVTTWRIEFGEAGITLESFWFGLDTYNTTYDGYITALKIEGCNYNPFI